MQTTCENNPLRELDLDEMNAVSGGVSQGTAIGTNMSIVVMGAGIAAAGLTAPAWFPIAMIGVSVAATGSYIYEQLSQ